VSIHVSEDDTVNALSTGLTQQILLLEDASQDGLMAEQTISKLLEVVRNQEKLIRREMESKIIDATWSPRYTFDVSKRFRSHSPAIFSRIVPTVDWIVPPQ
jgi:hypothetical protein